MTTTLETGLYDINQLCNLLQVKSWDDIEESNQDAWIDYNVEAHKQALANGLSEGEADDAASTAEGEARDEDYRKWLSAFEKMAETYFAYHRLNIEKVNNKKFFGYKVTSDDWDNSALDVMSTINGVGYFGFNSLKEFKASIPVKSSRQVTLQHLHWIRYYGEVYGEMTPSRIMDRCWR